MPTHLFSRTVMNFLKGKSSPLPQASGPSSSWLSGPLSSSYWSSKSSQLLRYILALPNLFTSVLCFFFTFWIFDKIFVQTRAGQIASILASLSSDQTSTLMLTWYVTFNSHHVPNFDHNVHQVALATTTGSFDGGDQGLLNTHFSTWATQVLISSFFLDQFIAFQI